jgi:serine/threonine-protein kinase RsbW
MNDTVQIFNVPSNPAGIHTIENIVEAYCLEHKLINKELYGNILIAATEAFTNALYHGNKNNPDKTITIEVESNESFFQIIITDQGNGFNPDEIKNPTLPENILTETGRGIYIMRALSDECEFLNNGSTVRLKFNL